MNLNNTPSIQQLTDLIENCDDHAGHHVLWVSKSGKVFISTVPEDLSPVGFEAATPDMRLRYETFVCGNDYVGPNAAKDYDHVSSLFDSLLKEWPSAKNRSDVLYIDLF